MPADCHFVLQTVGGIDVPTAKFHRFDRDIRGVVLRTPGGTANA